MHDGTWTSIAHIRHRELSRRMYDLSHTIFCIVYFTCEEVYKYHRWFSKWMRKRKKECVVCSICDFFILIACIFVILIYHSICACLHQVNLLFFRQHKTQWHHSVQMNLLYFKIKCSYIFLTLLHISLFFFSMQQGDLSYHNMSTLLTSILQKEKEQSWRQK